MGGVGVGGGGGGGGEWKGGGGGGGGRGGGWEGKRVKRGETERKEEEGGAGGWVAKSLLTVGCEDLANSPFAQPPRPHPPPPPSRQPDGGYLGMRCLLYFV